MSIEDEVKYFMYCREQIKDFKRQETLLKNNILQYLKNHKQEGVSFKYREKKVTLTIYSSNVRKNIPMKEKEKKVESILSQPNLNVHIATREIIESVKNLSLVDKKDKLKIKIV
jgi:hypothetical protein